MENFVPDFCRGYWIYLYASFRRLNCFSGHQIFHIVLTVNHCTIINFTTWKCHFLDIFAHEYGKQKISIHLTKCRITWVHILDSSQIEQTLSILKSPDIFLYILCELEKAWRIKSLKWCSKELLFCIVSQSTFKISRNSSTARPSYWSTNQSEVVKLNGFRYLNLPLSRCEKLANNVPYPRSINRISHCAFPIIINNALLKDETI